MSLYAGVLFMVLVMLIIIERRRVTSALRQAECLAFLDPLTQLPNRLLFIDRATIALAQSRRSGLPAAVLFIDLDGFKNVNDRHGHESGDLLLRAVATRIREQIRETDTAARLGGDEFLVLVTAVREARDADAIAQKILDAVQRPFFISGSEIVISASIGITIYTGDSTAAGTLLRLADAAMYRAKASGCGRAVRYAAQNSMNVVTSVAATDLVRAVRDGEFVLHYQPRFATGTWRVAGFEALLRWNHPSEGLLLPDHFLGAAEASGEIVGIGAFVLREACAEARRWQLAGHSLPVGVNLSARQLFDPHLTDVVATVLRESELPAASLEIELDQRTTTIDPEKSRTVIAALRSLGVKVVLSGFGRGYTSLVDLARFEFDALKLDSSLIAPGAARPVVAIAAVGIAKALGVPAVASGVESEEQLTLLASTDCRQVQGFLISRPIAAEACLRLLEIETAEGGKAPPTVPENLLRPESWPRQSRRRSAQ